MKRHEICIYLSIYFRNQIIEILPKMNTIIRRFSPSIFQYLSSTRAFSSVQNINDKNRETFVIGHRNPDTDAITAAIVYADFLNRMNIKATPYRLGDLNNETKFILKTAGIKAPEMLPNHVPDGTAVALVDHNESNG